MLERRLANQKTPKRLVRNNPIEWAPPVTALSVGIFSRHGAFLPFRAAEATRSSVRVSPLLHAVFSLILSGRAAAMVAKHDKHSSY